MRLPATGGLWGADRLVAMGSIAGGEMIDLGFEANESRPRFQAFDRYGHRIDEVRFHPSYHRLMTLGVEQFGTLSDASNIERLITGALPA